jgi:hypothetical protein
MGSALLDERDRYYGEIKNGQGEPSDPNAKSKSALLGFAGYTGHNAQ